METAIERWENEGGAVELLAYWSEANDIDIANQDKEQRSAGNAAPGDVVSTTDASASRDYRILTGRNLLSVS